MRKQQNQGNNDIANLTPKDEIVVNPEPTSQTSSQQEVPVPNIPMIPLSEVAELVERTVNEKLAGINQVTQQQPASSSTYEKKLTNSDDIPELRDFVLKDRIYVSVDGSKPSSLGIRTRHKNLSPLQYYNPETQTQHSLRYSTNQTSFFVDKQVGEALCPHISMKYGILRLSKEDANLQRFLHIHPDKDKIFKELDKTVENKKIIEEKDLLFEAQTLVRQLKFNTKEAVARVMCESFDDNWTVEETTKSLYLELEKDPAKFLRIAKDESIETKGIVKSAIKRGIIVYKNFKYISEKGDVILEVNRNEDELDAFVAFTETNKGGAFLQYIKGQLQ